MDQTPPYYIVQEIHRSVNRVKAQVLYEICGRNEEGFVSFQYSGARPKSLSLRGRFLPEAIPK